MSQYFMVAEVDQGHYHKGEIMQGTDAWCWGTETQVCIPKRLFARSDHDIICPGAFTKIENFTMPLPPNMDTFFEAHLPALLFNSPISDPDSLLPSTDTTPNLNDALYRAHGWQWSLVRGSQSLTLQKTVEGRNLGLSMTGVVREGTDKRANWWPLRGLVYHVPPGQVFCVACAHSWPDPDAD